jgi:hypothetical protein
MADVTPPVGLAAYAAAAISGADPVKTGFQGFRYEVRTGLLPFIFIFNTELLPIDVGGIGHFLVVVVCSIIAMGCFVAATQNWLLTRNRWYETVALLVVCFTLFRPGFWLDQIEAPYVARPAAELTTIANALPVDQTLRFRVKSQSRAGDDVEKVVRLTMQSGKTGRERLQKSGLGVSTLPGPTMVQTVRFGSQAAKYGLQAGDEILAVLVPADRPNRYWLALPALALLAIIVLLQLRRRKPALAPLPA